MRIRSFVLSLLAVAAWCLAPSAHASGTGGSDAGQGAGGTGTGGSAGDPTCTKSANEQSGTTCTVCDTSIGLCSDQLGAMYNYVCKSGASTELWCNGPARQQSADNASSCAVSAVGQGTHGTQGTGEGDFAVFGIAVAALAIGARRRRR